MFPKHLGFLIQPCASYAYDYRTERPGCPDNSFTDITVYILVCLPLFVNVQCITAGYDSLLYLQTQLDQVMYFLVSTAVLLALYSVGKSLYHFSAKYTEWPLKRKLSSFLDPEGSQSATTVVVVGVVVTLFQKCLRLC